MNKDLIKKIALALGVVLFFLVLSYAFVLPVLSGKVVNQSDISGHIGMSREMVEWNAEHLPIEVTPNEYNIRYLKTKQQRMGHTLHL